MVNAADAISEHVNPDSGTKGRIWVSSRLAGGSIIRLPLGPSVEQIQQAA